MQELHAPLITGAAAGMLGLLFVLLSGMVVDGRRSTNVVLGAGDEETHKALQVAIRSHANFAEYVPLILILIGVLEITSGQTWLVKGLAGALVLARVLHPLGMRLPAPNVFRAVGFLLTLVVLLVASIAAVLPALR